MDTSRVISGNTNASYEACYLPQLDANPLDNVKMITARQVEKVQREAYDEGMVLGREDAFKKFGDQLKSIVESISDTRKDFDQQTMEEIATLIITCSKELVRCELQIKPELIVAVVRESIGLLPIANRVISIHLNPEDCEVVKDAIKEEEGGYRINFVKDPILSRGGCMVLSEESRIDASIESRLAAVVKQMLVDDGNRIDV